tara:strand:+ start:241 stop:414 length:174 start_codon:yes stop_codon:yes gene_type:complete
MEMNDGNQDFKESYQELTNSMDETSKYASWLILGVFIGRFYQKYLNLKKKYKRNGRR